MRDVNKTYHQCPTHAGGRDWPYSAYSPETNVLYVQMQNMCADYSARLDGPATAGGRISGASAAAWRAASASVSLTLSVP